MLFRPTEDGGMGSPGTGARNRVYAAESRALGVEVVRQLLAGAGDFTTEDITHVIFVSCTGFTNPGPDYHIIRELGLRSDVERYTLGFMGCYAAFPALRMAAQFCEAQPHAAVLVLCLELCSLHMQFGAEPDHLLANSLFADGAAAVIVSGREPAPDRPSYRLVDFATDLIPSGESAMAWEIGDHGFNIVLSSYVPDIIGANVGGLVRDLLDRAGQDPSAIGSWAVHPGGRSILDKVEAALKLPGEALASSRKVLREFGNMSSATILFVLKDMLEQPLPERAVTLAMAFGPGLTVETALLERTGGSAFVPGEHRPAAARLGQSDLELALA